MSGSAKEPNWQSWLLLSAAGLAVALVSGRLSPHFVPDSASYLDYPLGSLVEMCQSIRTPAYPFWLWIIELSFGINAVPAVGVLIHATAAWLLMRELAYWGMARLPCWAAAFSVGFGCTAMDHINTISTDAIAASFGVMAAVATMRWARLQATCKGWIGAHYLLPMLFATIAIFIRPAYLFLIPWFFIVGILLQRVQGTSWWAACGASLRLSGGSMVPVFAWMLLRLLMVGDFGMLPFGHQNLAGITVQLVSDDELSSLDSQCAGMGTAVIAAKKRYIESGREFAAGAAGATMTVNSRWDHMTYHVVIPAANEIAGNDSIAQHDAIKQLNQAIVFGWPRRYCVWLAKSARYGAWVVAADIVMHPLFLFGIAISILAILSRSITQQAVRTSLGDSGNPILGADQADDGLRALSIVALTYLVLKIGFVILTSPPIGRFSDAAAIFLPRSCCGRYDSLVAIDSSRNPIGIDFEACEI